MQNTCSGLLCICTQTVIFAALLFNTIFQRAKYVKHFDSSLKDRVRK
jgi:hypothetical protein